MCVNSPNDSLCVSYRVKSMSSSKNSITSHSSSLWSGAIVCFCFLSNPFWAASCPRLQTKGSAAPARSDKTEPGLGSPAPRPQLHCLITKRATEMEGRTPRAPSEPRSGPAAPGGPEASRECLGGRGHHVPPGRASLPSPASETTPAREQSQHRWEEFKGWKLRRPQPVSGRACRFPGAALPPEREPARLSPTLIARKALTREKGLI